MKEYRNNAERLTGKEKKTESGIIKQLEDQTITIEIKSQVIDELRSQVDTYIDLLEQTRNELKKTEAELFNKSQKEQIPESVTKQNTELYNLFNIQKDILNELNKTISSLQDDANTKQKLVEQLLTEKKELASILSKFALDLQFFIKQQDELIEKNNSLQNELKNLKENENQYKNQIKEEKNITSQLTKELESSIKTINIQELSLKELEHSLDKKNTALLETQQTLTEKINELSIRSEQIKTAASNIERLNKEKLSLHENFEEKNEQVLNFMKELEKTQNELKERDSQVKEYKLYFEQSTLKLLIDRVKKRNKKNNNT